MLHRITLPLLAATLVPSYAAVAQVPPQSTPLVTTVLPANTPGLLLVNTTAATWGELNRFNPIPPEWMELLLAAPLFPTGVNPVEDIQSWLGDTVAIALLPTTAQSETIGSSTVLLAPVKDTSRLNAFIDKVKTTWQPQIERTYKGVTVLEWLPPNPSVEEAPNPNVPTEPDNPTEELPQPSQTPQTRRSLPSSRNISLQQPSLRWISNHLQAAEPSVIPLPSPTPLPSADPEPTPSIPSPPPDAPSSNPFQSRRVAIALLPNALVIANQGRALEKLIDAQAGMTPLANSPLFQRTAQHPQFGRSLIIGYSNVDESISLLTAFPKPSLPPTDSPNLPDGSTNLLRSFVGAPNMPLPLPSIDNSQLRQASSVYSTLDTFLWVQPEGVHGQTNFHYTTPQPDQATIADPQANQIMSRLPAATYLATNGRNFKREWDLILKILAPDPISQQFLTRFRDGFRSLIGLDLDKDIIAWLDREYVAFLFPTKQGLLNYISPNLNLGFGLMLQTSDRPTAEAALRKLEQRVKSWAKGEMAIVTRRVKGQPIVSWEGKDRGKVYSFLSYGWVDGDTLIVTTGAGPMAELNPKPYIPLNLTYTYRTATESLPTPNDGYFYINMGAYLSFLYGLILPYVPQQNASIVREVQRVLGTVRSVSLTSVSTSEKQQIDSLWVLSPTRKAEK